ncbi:MAG: deoxyguanosinetriphosphate triphosphohydrolase [Armatimonadota bacterium]|nr:MAG: deoxyguanosinetriphosphate triphosphohydrolase [Armatimonadota bacterium]
MTIREQTEELEAELLSPRAAKAAASRGRERDEPRCPLRTDFQRDRDRIIHSKSFRRLTYKTQVFIAPERDHYRTRLTHTLEVAQIARTIARALRLNEDLTEAIALGHDLGHTPFGHAGEQALDQAYRRFDPDARFTHWRQSLRVVEVLENDGQGLNLTWETRDGIARHSKGQDDLPRHGEQRGGDQPATVEGRVVMIADRIAYINHDIDDSIRGNLIALNELPERCLRVLGNTHSQRITTMVADLVHYTADGDDIKMGEDVLAATNELKDFLFERVYGGSRAVQGLRKVSEVVGNLFRYYMENSHGIPGGARPGESQPELARRVCDHIAGMTDRYAKQQFITHFLPEEWRAE